MDIVEKILNFIETQMAFYSYENFCQNSKRIKAIYLKVSFRTKKLYQWYINSRDISSIAKRRIWDYLNGEITEIELNQTKIYYIDKQRKKKEGVENGNK